MYRHDQENAVSTSPRVLDCLAGTCGVVLASVMLVFVPHVPSIYTVSLMWPPSHSLLYAPDVFDDGVGWGWLIFLGLFGHFHQSSWSSSKKEFKREKPMDACCVLHTEDVPAPLLLIYHPAQHLLQRLIELLDQTVCLGLFDLQRPAKVRH